MTRFLTFIIIIFFSVSAIAAQNATPSFDCSKATHAAEQFICKDADLAKLDHFMSQIYRSSLEVGGKLDAGSKETIKLLKATQHGWVRGRNDCWKQGNDSEIKVCVETEYKKRISTLQMQFRLTSIDETKAFYCPDNLEIIVSFFNATIMPGAIIEYGDQRKIFLLAGSGDTPKNYEGEFGTHFQVNDNAGTFLLDQFKAEIVCHAK